MTQQPFSRPGAVDLSGLQAPPATPAPGAPGVSGAYTVQVTEENFQSVFESSMNAAVVLGFYSATQAPDSVRVVEDLQVLANEMEGRFLLGRVDIDATPQVAQALVQAMQAPSIPLAVLLAQGRPIPMLDRPAPLEDLRTALTSVLQSLTANGFAGRHQPRAGGGVDAETGEEVVDPRYAPAQDALARGDVDAAIVEYQKLVDANAGDAEAAAGLAMAQLLKRTEGVDLNAARAAAAAAPDDVAAQTLVADLDLLGGHVEDAFVRLVNLVARTSDADRDAARTHLLGLFGAVGNDDPRVQQARRDLTSALF